ncbi:hypothetical protein LINPERPRIM_LOCUS19609 [Linum perenne]
MEVVHFQYLMKRDWEVLVRRTYREENKVVNYLTEEGHILPIWCHFFTVIDCNLG